MVGSGGQGDRDEALRTDLAALESEVLQAKCMEIAHAKLTLAEHYKQLMETCVKLDKKYRVEVVEKIKVEKLCGEMTEKHRMEYEELEKRHQFVLEGKREIEMRCADLQKELEFERVGKIIAKKECKKFEAMHQSVLESKHELEHTCACLGEMRAVEMLEKLVAEDKNKKLGIEKLKVENELRECKAQLEELKKQQIVNERECTRMLLEDSKESNDLEMHEAIASQVIASDSTPGNEALGSSGALNLLSGDVVYISDGNDDAAHVAP